MAGLNRKDWEDLNITKEEIENLSQALKKEEFRKLLSEYAEEITDPKNRKQYQDEIVQLEAERGIDCTFVNPEPGFVVKTSVDGNKKAFINICQNKAVGRPSSKPEVKNDSRGLNWSIPLCQAPGREDFDKKKNRCVVYDVVFHPDTLHLAEKNPQFKKLVIDTALNSIEEGYKVNLDKKNIRLPKLNFKGLPFATVIRRKSKKPPVVTEEEVEFLNKIKYPFKPPNDENPVIRNFENKKEETGKYTVPKYVIKHQTDIDMQDFTFDKNAKINAAIPKKIVVEINLPLLNSTQTVTLDVMEKSLHLLCEKPAKYKLDIQFPYSVSEEAGNAKFDKERRLLVVTLPVIKASTTIKDLINQDSGIESDLSPVSSVSNTELTSSEENNFSGDSKDSYLVVQNFVNSDEIDDDTEEFEKEFNGHSGRSDNECDFRTKGQDVEFLEPDKHYTLPGFSCNIDGNNICFILNVKNVDPSSLIKKLVDNHGCHLKFVSIGSGFFPIHYAFFVDFKNECKIHSVMCEAWDNNVSVLIEFEKNGEAITHYYAGLTEDSLVKHSLNSPLELKRIAGEILCNEYEEDDEEEDEGGIHFDIEVESANVNEVTVNLKPKRPAKSKETVLENNEKQGSLSPSSSMLAPEENSKNRTLSESGVDDFVVSGPIARKSILKKRISRSLSESNAEDYMMLSRMNGGVDRTEFDGSDSCIHEENEVPCIKKTVRFSNKIRQQLFRANSTILGRKNKNRKKNRNKKRALERRLSESENSEVEEKEKPMRDKKAKKSKQRNKQPFVEVIKPSNENVGENGKGRSKGDTIGKTPGKSAREQLGKSPVFVGGDMGGGGEEDRNRKKEKFKSRGKEKPAVKESNLKSGLKKNDKIFEFKSDLIFDLDY